MTASPGLSSPDFSSPDFLRAHVRHTLAFYAGRSVDPSGGFFHCFKDDGRVYDTRQRHLVSSARFVFNHAMAARHFGRPEDRTLARHGLAFIQRMHAQPQGGHAWLIDWHAGRATVRDATQHCYGQAFVLLAHAHALMAGIDEAASGLRASFELMEKRFWEPAHGLYADEATPDWQLGAYRGQNANMHACEAMLAAHEATGEARYLQRALVLAESVTQRLAGLAGGLVWEHYRGGGSAPWSVDWDYNREDRTNIFRPWGYQTGHLTEWAKLLLQLERRLGPATAPAWLLPTARCFFDTAMRHGWDDLYGGLVYGFGLAGPGRTAVPAPSATPTSISGCRPRAWPPPLGSPSAPVTPVTGPGTNGSGRTRGSTSSTTTTAPGTGCSRPRTKNSATRKARRARPITTRWAPVTTCCAR